MGFSIYILLTHKLRMSSWKPITAPFFCSVSVFTHPSTFRFGYYNSEVQGRPLPLVWTSVGRKQESGASQVGKFPTQLSAEAVVPNVWAAGPLPGWFWQGHQHPIPLLLRLPFPDEPFFLCSYRPALTLSNKIWTLTGLGLCFLEQQFSKCNVDTNHLGIL